jgi:hypothetical protein
MFVTGTTRNLSKILGFSEVVGVTGLFKPPS